MSQRVAVSPLGGVGFRPVEVANPKGGSLRCSVWRRVSTFDFFYSASRYTFGVVLVCSRNTLVK